MTNPGPNPDGTLTGAGGIAAWGQENSTNWKNSLGQGVINSAQGIGNFGVGTRQSLDDQLAIITNHTAQLSEQAAAIEQMTARGKAVVFSQSGWYYPPKDLVTLRLIGIGAGAGGAAGKWNLGAGGRFGGGGGGGGGYSEIEITAAFLPKTGDTFDPIRVDIYLAGNGGSGSEAPGVGGGNIIFGANLAKPYAEFQGGLGGRTATNTDGGGGPGGFGMVPGGYGGGGARSNLDEYPARQVEALSRQNATREGARAAEAVAVSFNPQASAATGSATRAGYPISLASHLTRPWP